MLLPVPVPGSSEPFPAFVLACSLVCTSLLSEWLLLHLAFLLPRNLAVRLVLLGVFRAAPQCLECRNTENYFLSKLRPCNADGITLSVDTVQMCLVLLFCLKSNFELLRVSTAWLYLVSICVTKILSYWVVFMNFSFYLIELCLDWRYLYHKEKANEGKIA